MHAGDCRNRCWTFQVIRCLRVDDRRAPQCRKVLEVHLPASCVQCNREAAACAGLIQQLR